LGVIGALTQTKLHMPKSTAFPIQRRQHETHHQRSRKLGLVMKASRRKKRTYKVTLNIRDPQALAWRVKSAIEAFEARTQGGLK